MLGSDSETLSFTNLYWLAEVVAVMARLSPETAQDDISDLHELESQEIGSEAIYLAAYDLSRGLNHHLFDTLYHAVALQLSDALLITADERYYTKARKYGNIALLADYDARH